VTEDRPELGSGGRDPRPGDIRRAIRLSRLVTIAATAVTVAASMIMKDFAPPTVSKPSGSWKRPGAAGERAA
jgi:hypothetical protein